MAITTERNKVIKYIELSLGEGMVDVELDKEHYDMAIDKAVAKYRQRSTCLLYTSPSPRDRTRSRMPSSA